MQSTVLIQDRRFFPFSVCGLLLALFCQLALVGCGGSDDGGGAMGPETPGLNTAPSITTPANASETNIFLEQSTRLSVDANDPDGDALNYSWTQMSGPGAVDFTAGDASITNATFTAPGTYELKVVVSDGVLSDTSTVTVKVTGDLPNDPTLFFDSPADGATFLDTQDIAVKITALDNSGIRDVVLWAKEAKDATFTSQGEIEGGTCEWTIKGLAPGEYLLRAKATANDADPVADTGTVADGINITVTPGNGGDDNDPPTPNPAGWASTPTAINSSSIRMTATTGNDANGVEYLFLETSGNPGATDSNWQSSPTYTDSGLSPMTVYSYTVTMRDTVGNTGDTSGVASITTKEATEGGNPNIVFIYADDLGYADISYNRSVRNTRKPYFSHTPNIDEICTEGVYFSNYTTHQMCSPSRAGLLTGRHYTEVGSGLMVGGELDRDVMTIAKDFQQNGYETAAFGKWHNGSSNGIGVNAYGFDEWEGFYGGGADYHSRYNDGKMFWWKNKDIAENDFPGYATDILGQRAVDFIDANWEKPFFLYVPFGAVHTPYHILSSDLKFICDRFDGEYPDLSWNLVKNFKSPRTNKTIEEVSALRCSGGEEFDVDSFKDKDGFAELVYYAMLYAIDRAVGDIRQKLQTEGLEEDTILVFASDNGATSSGNNGLLQGTKTKRWEGGIRVPAAMWWPGMVDKDTAKDGNKYPYLTQYIDWYPTLMYAAGLSVSDEAELDGVSFWNAVIDGTPARRDEGEGDDWFYGLAWNSATIKNNRFKLHYNQVSGSGHVEELYDLENDIGESELVNGRYPDVLAKLKEKLEAWFSSGDVTAGYMQLPKFYKDRQTDPKPDGDILEVTVNQTGTIDPTKDGLAIAFAKPNWQGNISQFVHAGDVLEYDIYVASDSDHTSGLCVSTTRKQPLHNSPVADGTSGIGLDNNKLVVDQNLQKNTWTRCVVGVGDGAPERSKDVTIGFWAPTAGTYHVYIDNVVIRKSDGSLRVVVWQDSSDTFGTGDQRAYFDDREYKSLTDLKTRQTGVEFGGFTLKTATLGGL